MSSHNNREYIRMQIKADINFSVRGESESFSGTCTDLSHSGVKFETEISLSIGDIIEAVIEPGSPGSVPLRLTFVVVRAESPDGKKFLVSGETIEIDGRALEIK